MEVKIDRNKFYAIMSKSEKKDHLYKAESSYFQQWIRLPERARFLAAKYKDIPLSDIYILILTGFKLGLTYARTLDQTLPVVKEIKEDSYVGITKGNSSNS